MAKQYLAKAVANKFIDIAQEKNCTDLSPMKLQKLIYFAHGWALVVFGGGGLIEEDIQAWPYGPVIQSIYHEFKIFGNERIGKKAEEAFYGGGYALGFSEPEIDPDDQEANNLINRIWEVYGSFTPIQLSNMTHDPGTPWDQILKQHDGNLPRDLPISNELICSYFTSLVGKSA